MPGKTLRIGLSPRFLHPVPSEMGFRGKTLQYLETSVAHWLMTLNALVFMIPSIQSGGLLRRGNIRIADYVDALDGLVLQGGADVSPLTYGEQPLKKQWEGDRIRDTYEIDLLQEFVAAGKPVLGICRGLQLINVAFGGSLYQDIGTQQPQALVHRDAAVYDLNFHAVDVLPDTRLAALLAGAGSSRINSVHHQGVKDLAPGFVVEARCPADGMIEAIRHIGPAWVAAVQWHPEFHKAELGTLDDTPVLTDFLDAARAARITHTSHLP